MLADLLERDRIRFGFTVGQAAYRLGLTPAQYRAVLQDRSEVRSTPWQRILSDLTRLSGATPLFLSQLAYGLGASPGLWAPIRTNHQGSQTTASSSRSESVMRVRSVPSAAAV